MTFMTVHATATAATGGSGVETWLFLIFAAVAGSAPGTGSRSGYIRGGTAGAATAPANTAARSTPAPTGPATGAPAPAGIPPLRQEIRRRHPPPPLNRNRPSRENLAMAFETPPSPSPATWSKIRSCVTLDRSGGRRVPDRVHPALLRQGHQRLEGRRQSVPALQRVASTRRERRGVAGEGDAGDGGGIAGSSSGRIENREGGERTVYEIEVDEIGPVPAQRHRQGQQDPTRHRLLNSRPGHGDTTGHR